MRLDGMRVYGPLLLAPVEHLCGPLGPWQAGVIYS